MLESLVHNLKDTLTADRFHEMEISAHMLQWEIDNIDDSQYNDKDNIVVADGELQLGWPKEQHKQKRSNCHRRCDSTCDTNSFTTTALTESDDSDPSISLLALEDSMDSSLPSTIFCASSRCLDNNSTVRNSKSSSCDDNDKSTVVSRSAHQRQEDCLNKSFVQLHDSEQEELHNKASASQELVVSSKQQQQDDLEEVVTSQKQKLQVAQHELAESQQQLTQMQAKLESNNRRLAALEQDRNKLSAQSFELELLMEYSNLIPEEFDQILDDVVHYQLSNQRMRQDLGLSSPSTGFRFGVSTSGSTKKKDASSSSTSSTNQQRGVILAEYDDNNDDEPDLMEEMWKLSSQVDEMESDKSNLKRTVKQLEGEVSQLQNKRAKQEDRIDEFEDKISRNDFNTSFSTAAWVNLKNWKRSWFSNTNKGAKSNGATRM